MTTRRATGIPGRRGRAVLVLTLVAVVVASVAVGTVSAATTLTGNSATDVEIGQATGQSQTVLFDITLNASESTSVTIDTGTGLGATSTTVTDASLSSVTPGFNVSNVTDGSGVVTLDISETGGSGGTATVGLTLTLDTSGQSTEQTGIQYTISDAGGTPQDTVTFDLLDGTAPTFDSAITGDEAAGSSTARDSVTLSFTEDGTGIDAATVDAGDFTVSGATVSGATVNGADEVVLALDSELATDATPTVNISGSLTDDAGNTLGAGSQTASDGLSPLQTGWAYDDSDADGTVDLLKVGYSEDVGGSSFVDTDWSVQQSGDPSVSNPTNVRSGSSGDTVLVDVSATADVTGRQSGSASNPQVQYSGTSVQDTEGNAAPTVTSTYVDVADPVVKTVSSVDSDGDGQVDRIDVTFTELISAGESSSASASDFTVGGADDGSVTPGSLTVPGDGPTVELAVTGPADDTSLSLTLDYAGTTLEDPRSNTAVAFTGQTITDGAAPVVTSATTLDRDGDGNVDAATLTFTEALLDATVTAGDFSLGGNAADAFDTLATADDDTLQVQISTDANEASGTGAVDVTHTSGTTADAASNLLTTLAAGDVSETDGAAPVVSSFSLAADDQNDELDVSFDASESLSTVSVSLSGPESATLTSFSQSGSTHSASVSVGTNGNYTATLDTADDAAGNSASSSPTDTATVSFVTTPTPTATPTSGNGGGSSQSVLSGTSSNARISGATGLFEVGVRFSGTRAGTIRATGVSSLLGETPPGTFVSAVDITVSDSLTETASTLKFALSRDRLDELGVDPTQLTVYRFHDGSWEALETRIVDRGSDTIVVEADTPGFSRFAVMAGGTTASTSTATSTPGRESDGAGSSDSEAGIDSDGSTSASTADGTPTQADAEETNGGAETTTTQTPGFGVSVALVSLLAFLAVGLRRRN